MFMPALSLRRHMYTQPCFACFYGILHLEGTVKYFRHESLLTASTIGEKEVSWFYRTIKRKTRFNIHPFLHRATYFLAVVIGVALSHQPIAASAQTNNNATKDPSAISAIQLALASMGGQPAISAIQDATIVGHAQASSGASVQTTWKTVAMAVRCEMATSVGTSIYSAANGVGYAEDTFGNVSQMNQRWALSVFPYVMPNVVLAYLLSAPDQSLSVIQDQSRGTNVVHIQALEQLDDPNLAAATKQDWYIDLNTGLPSRVDYDLINPNGQDGTATVLFNSWQTTSIALAPQSIQTLQNGVAQSSFTLAVPIFNQGLQKSIFTLP